MSEQTKDNEKLRLMGWRWNQRLMDIGWRGTGPIKPNTSIPTMNSWGDYTVHKNVSRITIGYNAPSLDMICDKW